MDTWLGRWGGPGVPSTVVGLNMWVEVEPPAQLPLPRAAQGPAASRPPRGLSLPAGPRRYQHCQDSPFFLSPLSPLPGVSVAEGWGALAPEGSFVKFL